MICPGCGHENAETAKFCSECGTALASASRPRREERKLVSVVFVDLVGSTARAEASDPEDVRALLRIYHERSRHELERYGGTVEKFIGDAVVAVFGAPAVHEDDPERAVRSALAVREAVARLNEEDPERDLHVRIAVNTGEALVSLDASPGEGEGMVAGDVVNTAARLQSAAPVDGILVGEQTHRATEREIVYREARPVEAKGKRELVRAYEAVEARSRLGVDLGGSGRALLVGRDEELGALAGALARARRERSTQLVTLVGVPGIGKSRLVYELGRIVHDDPELITWRQGRSLPYGEGVSFWALGEIVKAEAGILESDPAETAKAKLAEAVALVADASERSWVERQLRPLLGLGSDDAAGDRRGEAFAAWRAFLEAIAERAPAVLVFEDLQWADDGLLDFVDGLVDWVDGVPLLVVCTARPELLERRSAWGGGKRNATTVSLAPLDAVETGRLVAALLDRPVLPAETQQVLVERAAGNPLYAEEFVRLLESSVTVEGRLPATVQGIVAARIDLLPAAEKELLQHAAVLGKVFWSDALAALAGVEPWALGEPLRALERKEFVRRERRSAVAGATQHAFVHALVRDAAYLPLPRHARAERHLAAARWLETLPEDRAEDRAEMLAHHYLTAIELLRAAGEDTDYLAPAAVAALQQAGERALALGAFAAAARFLGVALDLLPEGEEPSADLLIAAGKAFGFVGRLGDELEQAIAAFESAGEYERAAEAAVIASWHGWHGGGTDWRTWLERAARLLDGRPSSRAKALVLAERARQAMLDYQYDTSIAIASEAIALAEEIGDDEIRADALVTHGVCLAAADERGIAQLEEALALVGHRGRVAGRAYNNLAITWQQRDLERAREVYVEGLARAEREGDEQAAWFLRGNLAGLLFSIGEWDEVLALAEAFSTASDAFRYMEPAVRSSKALILSARGDDEGALAEMGWVLGESRRSGEAQTLWSALIGYAWLARRCGLAAEAREAVEEVLLLMDESESLGDPQDWHILLLLELEALRRDNAARRLVERLPHGRWRTLGSAVAGRDYVAAAEVLASAGERALEAELRFQAARRLADAGRLAEGKQQLELARAFWRRVGAVAYLRATDELLAAAS